jgi:uncharacterized DUF497 family protein
MAKFILNQWLIEFIQKNIFSFEWDQGNETKNIIKHNVSNQDGEEVFQDENKIILGLQISPSTSEQRFAIIGKNLEGLPFFVCFTVRNLKIRIINIRRMSLIERIKYEERKNVR